MFFLFLLRGSFLCYILSKWPQVVSQLRHHQSCFDFSYNQESIYKRIKNLQNITRSLSSPPDMGTDFHTQFPGLCYYKYCLFPKPFPTFTQTVREVGSNVTSISSFLWSLSFYPLASDLNRRLPRSKKLISREKIYF